jgi:hypothetical protein
LERRINLTETEIAQMKEGIKMKRTLLRSLRMALSTFTPRAAKKSPRSARSGEVPAKV